MDSFPQLAVPELDVAGSVDLRRALGRLSPTERAVVIARYAEGSADGGGGDTARPPRGVGPQDGVDARQARRSPRPRPRHRTEEPRMTDPDPRVPLTPEETSALVQRAVRGGERRLRTRRIASGFAAVAVVAALGVGALSVLTLPGRARPSPPRRPSPSRRRPRR